MPFQPFAENYKIFYNNLELSWLKIEGQRTLFIDLLASEQGIQSIRALYEDQIVLLNTLLQTPKDLVTFLNHIQFASSETIINWLKLDGGIITKALSYYRTESVTAILEPIFYVMGNADQHGRSFLLEQIVGYRTVKDLLQDKIRALSSLVANNNAVDIMNALIRKSISVGISDFSHFIFYRNNQRIQRVCYLNQINFSNSNWIMTQFIEDVYSCHFYRMTFDETRRALRKQCAVEEPAIGVGCWAKQATHHAVKSWWEAAGMKRFDEARVRAGRRTNRGYCLSSRNSN